MKKKCFIFDLDGVILINEKNFSENYSSIFNVNIELLLDFFYGAFQKCLVGKADLKEELKLYINKWKWNGNIEELIDFWFKGESNIDSKIVKEIEKLRKDGNICILATNNEYYRTNYIKENLGLINLFDKIYSSSYVGYKKPEKNFYKHILDDLKNKYSILKEEIIFFDDSEKNIKGALENGIDSVLYKNISDFYKNI